MPLLVCILFTITKSQWIALTAPLLPSSKSKMGVGAYNQTISLIGGYHENRRDRELITYDIADDSFSISNISELLPSETISSSYSQYYTSVNEIIYLADYHYLSIYNMQTKTYTQ